MSSLKEADAGREIVRLLLKGYGNAGNIHTETLLGAAAALAGESALLAAENNLPETGWVFSEKALALIYNSPKSSDESVWAIIRTVLSTASSKDGLPDPVEITRRIAGAVGDSHFPPLSIPKENHPHEWSPNACPNFRQQINQIAGQHNLNRTQRTMALGFALAYILKQTRNVLDTKIAATLVLEMMIGVSRMVPLKEPL